MSRTSFVLAFAAYGLGVISQTLMVGIDHWQSDLPLDQLFVDAIGSGLVWPFDLARFLF